MKPTERFYKCNICGNVIGMIEDAGVPLYCCNQPMEKIHASQENNSPNAPKVKVNNKEVSVYVGDFNHNISDTDHVGWVYLETDEGGHRKNLGPKNRPEICFSLSESETPRSIFAYCNKHGLWQKTLSNPRV
jgi:superoxide reductase